LCSSLPEAEEPRVGASTPGPTLLISKVAFSTSRVPPFVAKPKENELDENGIWRRKKGIRYPEGIRKPGGNSGLDPAQHREGDPHSISLPGPTFWGAFDSAKNHKRQRRKRQSITAKREKSQTPKFVQVRLGQVRLG